MEGARARGWEELTNGELISVAEQAGFDLIVTTDKNIRYQQNLEARKISLIVLEHSQWPMVKLVAKDIARVVDAAQPGSYLEAQRVRRAPPGGSGTVSRRTPFCASSSKTCRAVQGLSQ